MGAAVGIAAGGDGRGDRDAAGGDGSGEHHASSTGFLHSRLHHDNPSQGHLLAALNSGFIYMWGQGVPIDYPRAMAAYKVGAEGGDAVCQWHVGMMYVKGLGVAVDYKQARPWIEKAAAQDQPEAVGQLGVMYHEGKGVIPSWRRARELYERAIELGDLEAVKYMQILTKDIAVVTRSGKPPHTTPLLRSHEFSFSPSQFVSQFAPLMDKRVEIHSASRADMNGKCGIATDFHYYREDQSKWRYTVQLDSGEAFKLKPANMRAERASAGKGKKARGRK